MKANRTELLIKSLRCVCDELLADPPNEASALRCRCTERHSRGKRAETFDREYWHIAIEVLPRLVTRRLKWPIRRGAREGWLRR